ncbi:hypothetical protein MTO96_016761 [Rhipicephalus appendiculatus]
MGRTRCEKREALRDSELKRGEIGTGQEQLLLSVIPAYIAAEVKRSIMLKMADACQTSAKRSRQRFHELYVQRHNNVRCVPCIFTGAVESYVARLGSVICRSETCLLVYFLTASEYPMLYNTS